MKTFLDRLLTQLELRGLSIGPGDDENSLSVFGPKEKCTKEVMEALKEFKPQLLERFGKKTQQQQAETVRQEAAAEGWTETKEDD